MISPYQEERHEVRETKSEHITTEADGFSQTQVMLDPKTDYTISKVEVSLCGEDWVESYLHVERKEYPRVFSDKVDYGPPTYWVDTNIAYHIRFTTNAPKGTLYRIIKKR